METKQRKLLEIQYVTFVASHEQFLRRDEVTDDETDTSEDGGNASLDGRQLGHHRVGSGSADDAGHDTVHEAGGTSYMPPDNNNIDNDGSAEAEAEAWLAAQQEATGDGWDDAGDDDFVALAEETIAAEEALAAEHGDAAGTPKPHNSGSNVGDESSGARHSKGTKGKRKKKRRSSRGEQEDFPDMPDLFALVQDKSPFHVSSSPLSAAEQLAAGLAEIEGDWETGRVQLRGEEELAFALLMESEALGVKHVYNAIEEQARAAKRRKKEKEASKLRDAAQKHFDAFMQDPAYGSNTGPNGNFAHYCAVKNLGGAILAEDVCLARWLPEVNDEGYTALMMGAIFGSVDAQLSLLDRKVDIAARHGSSGYTALHLAAQYGHRGSVACLLDRGCDINCRDNSGCTPLHVAASFGMEIIVRLLAHRGADVHAHNNSGWTPVQSAAWAGQSAVLRFFERELNMDVDTRTAVAGSLMSGDVTYIKEAVTALSRDAQTPTGRERLVKQIRENWRFYLAYITLPLLFVVGVIIVFTKT